jgi:phage gp36-like protein
MPAPIYQYAQVTDLAAGINPAALAGVDPTTQAGAIADASALIDSYLRQQFTLPLTKVGTDVRRVCVNVAIYYILVGRGYNPEAGSDPGIRARYEDAIAWLKAVASGTAIPDITDSTPGGAEGEIGARPLVISSDQRGFSSRADPNGRTAPFQDD